MAEVVRLGRAAGRGLDALPRVVEHDRREPIDPAALVAASQPVVIRGLVAGWPATSAGRDAPAALNRYLAAMDQGLPAPVMEAPAASGGRFAYGPDLHEYSFTKRRADFAATLARMERLVDLPDAPFVAIQMLPIASHLPQFLAENPMPLLPGVAPRLWIGGRVRTQTHNDRDHNLACVIAGRRRFVLFPPEQVAHLYVGPLDTPPPLSLVDPEAPDPDRFPRFAEALAEAQVAFLEPGDALFLPKHWWHHVSSLAPCNAMVNYWWGDDAPGLERPSDAFQVALLALRHLPSAERNYWRTMFETFVFADGDEAIAHIPADLRGSLGRLSTGARARLRQELLAALLKAP